MSRSPAAFAVAGVERACARAHTADEMFEVLDDELRRHVPFDASSWFSVDPATLLATAPSRIVGLDAGYCGSYWHSEFHDQDANLFRDLARDPVPAAALRLTTGGNPLRSMRFRDFVAPQGYDDELRGAFRNGDSTWEVAGFYRDKGRPAFSTEDVALLSAVSATVATALRVRAATAVPPAPATTDGPGLLLFDGANVLVSTNAEAASRLCEVYGPEPGGGWVDALCGRSVEDLRFAVPIIPLLIRARAVAAGFEPGPARLGLRDRHGRWLVLHASCMLGATGGVAVVVEPAKSAEIAPIIIEAYGLTVREREVVRAIARGLTTPEMASEMFLSPHTVRDYVKTVFDNVGVSSRGELVAKLFAEHYVDALHAAAVHVV